jgi:hypothetical protein
MFGAAFFRLALLLGVGHAGGLGQERPFLSYGSRGFQMVVALRVTTMSFMLQGMPPSRASLIPLLKGGTWMSSNKCLALRIPGGF